MSRVDCWQKKRSSEFAICAPFCWGGLTQGGLKMRFSTTRSCVYFVKAILFVGLLSLGAVVCAQTTEEPVTSQVLPNYPGRSLTAVEVKVAPETKVASHHHAGIVFAYVLEGTVRSQLNDGEVIEYHAGQYWVEPPGTMHTLTENPSKTMPARFFAVFIAPSGARLTTMEEPGSPSIPVPRDGSHFGK
jgi:quercetin dioxygenase-like cupin family protein